MAQRYFWLVEILEDFTSVLSVENLNRRHAVGK